MIRKLHPDLQAAMFMASWEGNPAVVHNPALCARHAVIRVDSRDFDYLVGVANAIGYTGPVVVAEE